MEAGATSLFLQSGRKEPSLQELRAREQKFQWTQKTDFAFRKRELTKKYEEIKRDTATHLIEFFTTSPPKGEMVLLFAGYKLKWEQFSEKEQVKLLESQFGLSITEAIKAAAELRGVSKREIYKVIKTKKSEVV